MTSVPDISVVMISCDRVRQLSRALDSVQTQQLGGAWTFEIVVVDDGSKDGTAALLESRTRSSPVPFRFVRTEGVGVPGARNLGAAQARGRWIASFDDDQLAEPAWLESFRVAAQETGATCFGGALSLLLPEDPELPRSFVAALGPRTRALLGEHLVTRSLAPYPEGQCPATNNALVLRSVFEQVGGFDTSFKQGGSDTDFFERVQEAGHAIWFVPQACALHVIPRARLANEYLRWVSLKVGAGRVRILRKRMTSTPLLRLIALRLAAAVLRDLPSMFRAWLRRDARAVLDARCSLWFTRGLVRAARVKQDGLNSGSRFLDSLNFRAHAGERDVPHA